jgi:hypothetical protein
MVTTFLRVFQAMPEPHSPQRSQHKYGRRTTDALGEYAIRRDDREVQEVRGKVTAFSGSSTDVARIDNFPEMSISVIGGVRAVSSSQRRTNADKQNRKTTGGGASPRYFCARVAGECLRNVAIITHTRGWRCQCLSWNQWVAREFRDPAARQTLLAKLPRVYPPLNRFLSGGDQRPCCPRSRTLRESSRLLKSAKDP